MSIKSDVNEMESIKAEIKRNATRNRELREQLTAVKARIAEFLKSKDQVGVKYQDKAILLDHKETSDRKKKKDMDIDAKSVLERYGIQDTDKVWQEIITARKGNPIVKTDIVIQDINKKEKRKKKTTK